MCTVGRCKYALPIVHFYFIKYDAYLKIYVIIKKDVIIWYGKTLVVSL